MGKDEQEERQMALSFAFFNSFFFFASLLSFLVRCSVDVSTTLVVGVSF